MSLELKISAGNARKELEDVASAVTRLKAALEGVPQATKFNNLIRALNSFTGINSGAISSVERLATVVNQLAAARDLGAVARGLNALARVDVGKVAGNVERLSAAMRNFVVPRGLAEAAAAIDHFSRAAQNASAQTRGLTASLRGLKVPAGLSSQAGGVNKLAAAFNNAHGSASVFGGTMGSLTGVLAGFGVTLGGVGFARFISGLSDAEKQMASFKSITNVTMKDAGGSAASMQLLTDVAGKLGLPLRDLVDTYPKFAASLRLSGQDAATTNKIYRDLSVGLAGVGADAIKTQRVFKAVEQMFNKGSVTAEELKQQLGDAIPGAVSTFAKSMGIGTQELLKMMEAGKVSSANVSKFAAMLAQEMGPAAEAMAKTWIGASNRMANEWYKLQLAVSQPFFDALIPSVNKLSAALGEFVSSGAAARLGAALGTIAGAVVDLGASLVNLMSGPMGGFIAAAAGMMAVALPLAGVFKMIGAAASLFSTASLAPMIVTMGRVGIAAVGMVSSMAMLNPMLLGLGVAVAAIVVAYRAFSGSSDDAARAAEQLYKASSGVKGEVDTMGEAMYVAAHASDAMGVSLTQNAAAQRIVAAEVAVLEATVEQYNAQVAATGVVTDEVTKKMEEVTARMAILQDTMKKLKDGAAKYTTAQEGANSATNSASVAADKASSKYDRLSSSMATAKSRAQSLDEALSALASSQREYDTSTTTVETLGGDRSTSMPESRGPIGFEGDLFDRGSLFSGGGISHKGTNNKFRNLPAALWRGAPKLAGGIENTNQILGAGGIPAILHPNEAVVPLTGGGSIPIAGGGGGASAQIIAGGLTQLLSATMNTNLEVARVKEAVQANTAVLKNAIDKVNMTLQGVSAGVQNLRSIGGGGGGTIGSGTGGGTLGLGGAAGGNIGTAGALAGGVGGSGALFDFAQQVNSLSSSLTQANDRTDSIWNNSPKMYIGTGRGGNNPGTFLNPSDRASYADAQSAAAAANRELQNYLWSNPTLAAAYYREKAANAPNTRTPDGSLRERYLRMAAEFESGVRGGSSAYGRGQSGFAKGSPNAWRDMKGGFQAMLHPNEAVIPLPDGRSVPVQMPAEVNAVLKRMNDDYRSSSAGERIVDRSRLSLSRGNYAGQGGGAQVTVIMNVDATDAASFSKSKAQIMQEFKAEFDRIASRYGSTDRREDPTRRTKRT